MGRWTVGSLLFVALWAPVAARGADPPPPAFDPHRGIDRNGRIPKVALPPDLGNPARWRYVPEGRLKPGNVLQRFLVSSFVGPVLFFDNEVGFGGGFVLADIDFRNTRRRESATTVLTWTTRGQQEYSFAWKRRLAHRELRTGGVIFEERSFVRAGGGYRRTLTRRFFGLGPERREREESDYTEERVWVRLGGALSVPEPGSDPVLGLGFVAERVNLARGRVRAVTDTRDRYPELFADGDGRAIGWLEAHARYDTRDSVAQPYHGWVFGTRLRAAVWQDTGEQALWVRAFGSVVLPVPPLLHDGGDPDEENPPTDTIALGAQLDWTGGALPFWALPSLGGNDTLRGYVPHRWTDRAAWHLAFEYRFWFLPRGFGVTETIRIERLGAALFAETGQVGGGLSRLVRHAPKWSVGLGLRVAVERTTLFRIEGGLSREGPNLVLDAGLTF